MKKKASERFLYLPHEYENAKTSCVMKIMDRARRYYEIDSKSDSP